MTTKAEIRKAVDDLMNDLFMVSGKVESVGAIFSQSFINLSESSKPNTIERRTEGLLHIGEVSCDCIGTNIDEMVRDYQNRLYDLIDSLPDSVEVKPNA